MSRSVILMREHHEVNTDPQRRCYNGCHYSSEIQAGPWLGLETVDSDHVDERLKFWRRLNEYAVSQRGPRAQTDFKAVPYEEYYVTKKS